MSNITEVVVQSREKLGTGHSRRLRHAGMVPSVVYGKDGDSVPVSVEPKAIGKIIQSETGMNTVLNLRLAGTEETRHVMIKSLDRHPVTDRLMHVDFLRIDMDKKVRAVIPVELSGFAEGVKLGGHLTIVRHKLEIECLPSNLIGVIKVDISDLGLNSTLRIGDLPQFEGVEYILGPKRTVATLRMAGTETTAEAEAEEDEDEE
ncbi:MAG: 50S ribosomal protein L25 [Acidobacteriota bacterium]|nr:50S ribosomal protein L25 [Acidobacteriota bacterium]